MVIVFSDGSMANMAADYRLESEERPATPEESKIYWQWLDAIPYPA
ncbi:hypothetical protein [Sporomusa sphaeroides]|uniref:Uncharacterized protein n=1 Tax=Sporomusa sphaeroides DSM 2875 TaxID=1337886 RepID=A0ABM9VZX0_9FIRM|nr:hypothetical protein [Sporomusa sphaeroides]OLS56347.1 hypothetical protein SPSPH_27400 [Sporomusa sphaeroides DSM 2875]CVK18442.1 hypothetical protein SSPH_01080 [Sporomusa sphaeroides DSM 2875]